jgi:hypothetical protein
MLAGLSSEATGGARRVLGLTGLLLGGCVAGCEPEPGSGDAVHAELAGVAGPAGARFRPVRSFDGRRGSRLAT